MKTLLSDEVGDRTDGSCYRDRVDTTYFNLINLFGLPTFGKGDKVLSEWVLENDDGEVATIYDYKSSVNDPSFVTDWHLGGNDSSYEFIQKIKEKLDTASRIC